MPAPAMSPLIGEALEDEVGRVQAALNTLHPGAVDVIPFDSLGQLAEEMTRLIQTTEPLQFVYAG